MGETGTKRIQPNSKTGTEAAATTQIAMSQKVWRLLFSSRLVTMPRQYLSRHLSVPERDSNQADLCVMIFLRVRSRSSLRRQRHQPRRLGFRKRLQTQGQLQSSFSMRRLCDTGWQDLMAWIYQKCDQQDRQGCFTGALICEQKELTLFRGDQQGERQAFIDSLG